MDDTLRQLLTLGKEFYLKRSQGENRAESAQYLAENKMALDKTMAPIENLWAKIENRIAGFSMGMLSRLLHHVSVIAGVLGGSSDVGDDEGAALIEAAESGLDRIIRNRPDRMR